MARKSDTRVMRTASGYVFCNKADSDDCPAAIDVLWRKPGEYGIFDVSRMFASHSYSSNEEGWEYEQSKSSTRK
jgi:hypothetical protein